MMVRHLLPALVLLTIAALGVTATATTVRLASIPQLGQRASLIIEGTVIDRQAVFVGVGPGVFTDHRVKLHTPYKGQSGEVITVRVPGGKTAQREVQIEGMPQLEPNTHVLLFLEELPSKAFPDGGVYHLPVGLEQGHRVVDESGQQAVWKRSGMSEGMVSTQPWCDGGEWVAEFDAQQMRTWLKQTFVDKAKAQEDAR